MGGWPGERGGAGQLRIKKCNLIYVIFFKSPLWWGHHVYTTGAAPEPSILPPIPPHVRHTPRHTASTLVQLGLADTFNLLLVVVELLNLSQLVGIKPPLELFINCLKLKLSLRILLVDF